MPNSFGSFATLSVGGKAYTIHRLSAVEVVHPQARKLPYSLKILLENLLRNENGLSVRVDKVLRYFAAGYSVNNVDAQYTVTPQMLEIDGAHSVLSREPWIEYWPSY